MFLLQDKALFTKEDILDKFNIVWLHLKLLRCRPLLGSESYLTTRRSVIAELSHQLGTGPRE